MPDDQKQTYSDKLKKIYEAEGKLKYFFDDKVPRDLFRRQKRSEAKKGVPALHPDLVGFTRKDGSQRLPDVEVIDGMVQGCRCTKGDYRGISLSDMKQDLPGMKWYKLPGLPHKEIEIPAALAITQDGDQKGKPNHYTIAPKDNMPLPLFLVWLNALERHLTEET
jgi:hypothetical protein